jgi:16S rRNA G1207 methylase RsmC
LAANLGGVLEAARPAAPAWAETKVTILPGDFLATRPGRFDRVVMNPPFANGQDIEHILHARSLLLPRGRLVALCAGGPRQAQRLKPLVDACGGAWQELPAGTFEGTDVRAVLLTIEAGA